MNAKLTTHVLDTAAGRPAAGMRIQLFRGDETLADLVTNDDGRCDAPLLSGDSMFSGPCRLVFHVGDFLRKKGISSPFLDLVPIEFHLESDQSYHVPLVFTPWSYGTYRGS
ncbi:MAG: hydroxyisourate hydrolase [Verrucomicrobiota bacterium]